MIDKLVAFCNFVLYFVPVREPCEDVQSIQGPGCVWDDISGTGSTILDSHRASGGQTER